MSWQHEDGDRRQGGDHGGADQLCAGRLDVASLDFAGPMRRAEILKAKKWAAASPMVMPQMRPIRWWRAASGSANSAASRQTATYRAIV
ncbi:hypothetical protein OSI08_13530 [Mycobacterium ulcerans]